MLAGSCLLLLLLRPRSSLLYQGLAVAVALIGSLSVLGYAFGTTALYGWPKYTGIALHTSVALTALAAGLLLARPNQGIAALIFDPGIGGWVARRLLPPAILLPFLLGWLRIQGERSQAYDAAFGTAIVMLLLIVIFSGLVLIHAGTLARADQYRRHAEAAIRKSQAMLARAQQVAKLGSWEWDIASGELLWSDEIYRILDLVPGEFQPTHEAFLAAMGPENRGLLQAAIEAAFAGRPYRAEYQIAHRDSSLHHILAQGEVDFDAAGKPVRMFGTAMDITERKRAEEEREITVEFLRLVNTKADMRQLIEAAVTVLPRAVPAARRWASGCKDGDDYPYYEAAGSRGVRLLENQLCARDDAGQPIRDSAGNPVIECMCGNVICGRFDPSKPFFTARGVSGPTAPRNCWPARPRPTGRPARATAATARDTSRWP